MATLPNNTAALLSSREWVTSALKSSCVTARRDVLIGCAEMMLPYWEARYQDDDNMERIVAAMRRVAIDPSVERQQELRLLIPRRRLPRRWAMSPPEGVFLDSMARFCPADFAGDAIIFAALEVSSGCKLMIDGRSAIDATIESIARLFGERDLDTDSSADHYRAAQEFIRLKLLAEK